MKTMMFISLSVFLSSLVWAQDVPWQHSDKKKAPKPVVVRSVEKSAAQVQEVFDGAKSEPAQQEEIVVEIYEEVDPHEKLRGQVQKSEAEKRRLELELERKDQEAGDLQAAISKVREDRAQTGEKITSLWERHEIKKQMPRYQEHMENEKQFQNGMIAATAISCILSLASPFVAMGLQLAGIVGSTVALGLGMGGMFGFVLFAIFLGWAARTKGENVEFWERQVKGAEKRIQEIDRKLGEEA